MGTANRFVDTKAATVAGPLASWQTTPIRSLLLLDPSLDRYTFEGDERVVIGRSSGCTWQIRSEEVSRRHVELTLFRGKATIKRHLNATAAVRVNGVDIGTRPMLLEPWTFLELGDMTILIEGKPDERPTEALRIAGLSDQERAIRYLGVYGSLNAIERATSWSRQTARRRLKETETGLAFLAMNSEENDARVTRSTFELSDGVPEPITPEL